MARQTPSNSPNRNPLPDPWQDEEDDLSQELTDELDAKIDEAVQSILNSSRSRTPRSRTSRRPRPTSQTRTGRRPVRRSRPTRPTRRRIAGSNLQPARNTTSSCCNCCDDMLGMFYIINESTTKILESLKAEHLIDKKKADQLKKDKETRERREKEHFMETTGRKMTRSLATIVSPLKNALAAVWNFIQYTFLGRVFNNILKWFSDPSNKKKVESLARFLKDWWPALLGAFVLFGTRFGASIRGLVGAVIKTILFIKNVGIVSILKGLASKRNLIGGALAIGGLAYLFNNPQNNDSKQEDYIPTPSTTPTIPGSPSLSIPAHTNGGIIRGVNFLLPEERHVSEIAFAEGGHINDDTGIRITGAGPDTQLIAAQPGEIVMSKAAVEKYGADTLLKMNLSAGSSNRPKFVNNIQLAKDGGFVGGMMQGLKNFGQGVINTFMPRSNKQSKPPAPPKPSGPKISAADYNALLAITAAEDSDPQGRADVAQSLYNRLLAGSQYGENFLPTEGKTTIKNLITGSGQYEPTFKNTQDWLNITDRNSAAKALANYKNIDIKSALKMLSESESALKNKIFQTNAQKHVGSRPSFYGISQRDNMKPGDALRYDMINGKRVDRPDNFFTHYPSENSEYHKKRGNSAAPIPIQLQVPQLHSQIPKPRTAGQISYVELPPINMKQAAAMKGSPESSDVPEFSAIPKYSDRYGDNGKLNQLGIMV